MRIFGSKSEKRRYYLRLRISLYCIIGAVVLVAVGLFYGFLNLPFLKIKSIQISGVVKMEDIRPQVLSGWTAQLLGLNNFLSWPGSVSGVSVEKDYGKGTLTLVGQPADRFAVWCAKKCFWVNRKGTALEGAPDTEGGTIAKINDDRDFNPVSGDTVVGEREFAAIAGIIDGLATVPISIEKISFNSRLQELVAQPTHGAKLIFSARFVPNDKLFSSLNNLVATGQIKASEYADFTVENRIYLK